MASVTGLAVRKGTILGIASGVLFAMSEVIGAASVGEPSLPVRMAASVVLGRTAFAGSAGAVIVGVSVVCHVILSGTFGSVFGLLVARIPLKTRGSVIRLGGLGAEFGGLLWLINFQVIGAFLYPWYSDVSQFPQAILHSVCFGLPLGAMYALGERPHARHAPTPAI